MKITKRYGVYYFTLNGKNYAIMKQGDSWKILEHLAWHFSSPMDELWNTPPLFDSPIFAILWWKKHCKEYI